MERTVKIEVEMPGCFVELLEFIFGCPFDSIPEEINNYITNIAQSCTPWLNLFAANNMVTYYPRVSMFEAEDYRPYERTIAQIANEIMRVEMGRSNDFINTFVIEDAVELFIFAPVAE